MWGGGGCGGGGGEGRLGRKKPSFTVNGMLAGSISIKNMDTCQK